MIGSLAHPTWRLVALSSIALLLGCGSFPTLQAIAAEVNATLQPAPTLLVPGDTIEVKFPYKPEYDHTVVVREDGRSSFLFLDEIYVGGSSVETLDRVLSKAYRDRPIMDQNKSDLTVNLINPVTRNVVVMGEVGSSGAVPIEGGRLSLLEALGKAGGPDKATALLEELVLIRWMPKEGRQRVWQINAAFKYWQSGTPILLQPHDIIFIPNTRIDRVNTWIDQYIRRMIPIPGFIPL